MEHVGKHLEKEGGDLGAEVEDVVLREWMRAEGLIAQERGRWVVAGIGGRRRGRGVGAGAGPVVVSPMKEEEDADEAEVDGQGEADADGEDE